MVRRADSFKPGLKKKQLPTLGNASTDTEIKKTTVFVGRNERRLHVHGRWENF